MITLTNNVIQIEVALKGAELQSLYSKSLGLEYLWSGDPSVWGKKSPVLFPIVGGLKNGKYAFKRKEYSLGRHGFARDMEFILNDQTDNSLTFKLEINEATQKIYPFLFAFSVIYTLVDNSLEITYRVENKDNDNMYFSVGAHPAFKIPLVDGTAYEDYYLLFNKFETAGIYPLSADGLTEVKPVPFFESTNKLPLRKELFEKDALVFKELASTEISIANEVNSHGIKVTFNDFPYMGIWAAKGANFLCIEPWDGIADRVDATGKLEKKEGILTLSANAVYEKSFIISVY